MQGKDRLGGQQQKKNSDVSSNIDISAMTISDVRGERSKNISDIIGKPKDKFVKKNIPVEESNQSSQFDDDYGAGANPIKGTRQAKAKNQEVTEMRDLTSLVSDEVLYNKGASMKSKYNDNANESSPKFSINKKGVAESKEDESKYEFDNDQVDNYEPIKIKLDANKKAKGKFQKEQIKYSSNEEGFAEGRDNNNILDNIDNDDDKDKERKKRKSIKTDNFFDFTDKLQPKQKEKFLEEEGLKREEVDRVAQVVLENTEKKTKRRKRRAKLIREIVLFFTSKSFFLFHMTEFIIFWLIIIIFPQMNVMNCAEGHHWMTHIAMGMFLVLTFIFDWVFCSQYMQKEYFKSELNSFDGITYQKRSKGYACLVGSEAVLQLFMTQGALLQIYCIVLFISITYIEGMKYIAGISLASLLILVLFKLYALGLVIAMFFSCCIREEDKKRKYAFRALIFSEFRLQALNVDYKNYNKRRTELLFGLMKFIFVDLPQFVVFLYYLITTDCGLKNANYMVYLGIAMHVVSTYFGFVSRFVTMVYHFRRANAYKRKLNLKISNNDLQQYGFYTIRNKMSVNKKVESILATGETYEYLNLDEEKMKKFIKTFNILPEKYRVEFFELNKVKIGFIRQAKALFLNLYDNFPNLKFVTIQQCNLCHNFVLQLNKFIDDNDTLLRFSLIMNNFQEDEILSTIERCLEHPNLEVLQIAQKIIEDEDNVQESQQLNDQQLNKVSLMKGIQVRLTQNESLKKLEIRYFSLSRQMLQVLFRSLGKNRTLQKLVLTNETLENGDINEFQLLGESLKSNNSLRIIDFSENANLNDNVAFHSEISSSLFKNSSSLVQRLYITCEKKETKIHYLKFIDDNGEIQVYNYGRILEDVDVQGRPDEREPENEEEEDE